MSLYNILFGKNPCWDIALKMIDRVPDDFGRFRDAWIKDNKRIVVYTRDGGNNRDCQDYSDLDEDLNYGKNVPDPKKCCTGCLMTYVVPTYEYYIRDKDDSFDRTYAKIYFRIPDRYLSLVSDIIDEDPSYVEDPLYLELTKKD